MIEPRLADQALLADIAAADPREDRLYAWWLGQSGFLVQWTSLRLVFDPYLSDTLTAKYAGTSQEHVRISRRVVDPSRLTGVSLVTATHHHTDHLDPGTLVPLLSANPAAALVAPRAWRALAAARTAPHDGRVITIDAGDTITVGPWWVSAVPAAHETIETTADGLHRFLGFLVRVGPFTLYHAGDTVRYAGLADRLRDARVDVAFLPINGRDPARGVPGNLTGEEAAALARDANIGLAVPCHYGLFAFNTASPAGFAGTAAALGQPARVLALGERLEYDGPRA